MHGIIFLIIFIILGTKEYFKNTFEDIESKINSPTRDHGTYTDHEGRTRDIKTDRILYYTRNNNNDLIIKDEKGRVVRNLTEEKFQKKMAQAKREGKRAVLFDVNHCTFRDEEGGFEGFRYKDVYTGRVLTTRRYKGIEVYMDLYTRKIVSFSDNYVKIFNERHHTQKDKDKALKLLEEVSAGNYFPAGQWTKEYH